MKKRNNPFDTLILDDEEQALETALAQGEYEVSDQLEETKTMLKEAAAKYQQLNTSKPVTLRINQLDLIKIKAKAKRNNIPYQTLLGALIHDFAEGETEIQIK